MSRVAPLGEVGASVSTTSTLGDWRRITLEKQLPRARFPAGVAVPSLIVLVSLVVIAGLSVIYLGEPELVSGSSAIAHSQRELTGDLARSLRAAATEATDDIRRAAQAYADAAERPEQAALAQLSVGQSGSRWLGAMVVDPSGQLPPAVVGDPVPVTNPAAPAGSVSLVPMIMAAGNAALLISARFSDGRQLFASASLVLRPLRLDPGSRHSLILATSSGSSAHSQGVSLDPGDRSLISLVLGAAKLAIRDRRPTTLTSGAGPGPGPWLAPIATAAPVGDLDLAVVSVVDSAPARSGNRWRGVPAAAALILVALLAFSLTWLGLVRPVRRLLAHAKAAACGEVGPHKHLSRSMEIRTIAAALDQLSYRTGGSGRRRPAKRGAVPALMVVMVGGLTILLWSAAVVVTYGRGAEPLPGQVVLDSQNQVDALAVAVGDVLERGQLELARASARLHAVGIAALRQEFEYLAKRDHRYRSLYLLDGQGRETARVGRKPLRGTPVPAGEPSLTLDPTSSRVPLIFASAPGPAGSTLVAEYDVRFIASVLRRVDGTARIVDDHLRTIASTSGYIAFATLSPPSLRDTAVKSLTARTTPHLENVGQVDALVMAAGLVVGSQTAPLRFSVVVSRSVLDFPVTGNELRRGTWLVAFLGLCVALLFIGWHHFVIIKPLSQVVRSSQRLVQGDLGHVISPVRHDEVGAIAICLDISRQALAHGGERLAGALRLRGGAGDHTIVLQRVRASQPPVPDGTGAAAPAKQTGEKG